MRNSFIARIRFSVGVCENLRDTQLCWWKNQSQDEVEVLQWWFYCRDTGAPRKWIGKEWRLVSTTIFLSLTNNEILVIVDRSKYPFQQQTTQWTTRTHAEPRVLSTTVTEKYWKQPWESHYQWTKGYYVAWNTLALLSYIDFKWIATCCLASISSKKSQPRNHWSAKKT